jgi:hypothetical protein
LLSPDAGEVVDGALVEGAGSTETALEEDGGTDVDDVEGDIEADVAGVAAGNAAAAASAGVRASGEASAREAPVSAGLGAA